MLLEESAEAYEVKKTQKGVCVGVGDKEQRSSVGVAVHYLVCTP